MANTTAVCNSAKVEFLQAGHCTNVTQTGVTATNSTSTSVTGLASTAGLAVGMAVTGTNVAANTVIAAIVSSTAITLSVATTGSATSLTFTGDVFKLALIKVGAGTYNNTQTNIGTPGSGTPSATNLGTDEVTGTSYVSGGATLVNISPILSTNTACASFGTVTWSSATISTTGAIIYNSSSRLGGATPTGRTLEVLDFGGTQTVTNGTLTLTMPSQAAGTSLLQIA